MKGIKTGQRRKRPLKRVDGSDHCPAMKGIKTMWRKRSTSACASRSDHCPAMKGIKTRRLHQAGADGVEEATTAPQ